VYQLEPGDVVSWPHNAPHRIENLDSLNVSLSTGFVTEPPIEQ
jgi:quercetin dioxygenase-like cupin family protein